MTSPFGYAEIAKYFENVEPAHLGPGSRPGAMPLAGLNRELDRPLNNSSLPATRRDLVRATILLWHDHLDPSHLIAQAIENPDGSYVHGLIHRREPDYGNARYWFRRVGRHPCFAQLPGELSAIHLEMALASKLLRDDRWDPLAFTDACEKVAGQPASDPQVQTLRALQAAEFESLLKYLCLA